MLLSSRLNRQNKFNLFRLCRKNEISFDIVAETGNIVEATFDFVEKNWLVAFDNVAGVDGALYCLLGMKTTCLRLLPASAAAGSQQNLAICGLHEEIITTPF